VIEEVSRGDRDLSSLGEDSTLLIALLIILSRDWMKSKFRIELLLSNSGENSRLDLLFEAGVAELSDAFELHEDLGVFPVEEQSPVFGESSELFESKEFGEEVVGDVILPMRAPICFKSGKWEVS